MSITTAEVAYNADRWFDGSDIKPALYAHARYQSPVGRIDAIGDTESVSVKVYINHGRWLVDCPFGCGVSQVAAETDHRFYCGGYGSCQNKNVNHQTIKVIWPEQDVKQQILEALAVRPTENQNWFPSETVADLQRENEENLS